MAAKAFSTSATGYVAGSQAGQFNVYYGFVVTTATATATLLIRNGSAGTVLGAIPVTSAIGYNQFPAVGIGADDGLYLDLNGGTGTVTIFYD